VSITLGATSGPTIHNGRVTKDETWLAADSPHLVGTNVDLEAVVTIEPGTIVQFRPGGRILVGDGALIAQGGSSLITFTGQESVPGYWQALEFSEQARPGLSVLDNCLIEYGGSDADGSVVVKSPVRIDNCVIRRSETCGVHASKGGFSSFSHNTLSDNLYPGLAIDPMLVSCIGAGNSFTGNHPNMVYIIRGEVTADTRWPNLGVPYLLDDMLYVSGRNGVQSLVIESGTQLRFIARGGIEVDELGALVADGSAGMITFGPAEDPEDWWRGIVVYGDELGYVQAVFKNCLIENADNDEYDECAITVVDAVIDVENSIIRNSPGYGIVCAERAYFAGFHDNVISGCGYQALLIDQEFVRTIGAGNSLTGNDVEEEYRDGVVVENQMDGVTTSATWPNLGVPYLLTDGLYISDQTGTPPILTIAPGAQLEVEDGRLELWEGELVVGANAEVKLMDADIEIGHGILTIGPGARFEFDHSGIYVEDGVLLADGSSGRITFTSLNYPDANKGDWVGIVFEYGSASPPSLLQNCLVEYGGTSGGNVVCNGCSPVLVDNEIDYSSMFGIRLHNSQLNPDTLRAENRFRDNDSGSVGVRPPLIVAPTPRKDRSIAPRHPHRERLDTRPASPREETAARIRERAPAPVPD
jgi:hypothetical protein